MYVKASHNIEVIDFSCLFLLFWIKTGLQYSVGLHVFICVNVKQLSMNGDLEAKRKTQTFSPLCSHVYNFEPFFYLVNYL